MATADTASQGPGLQDAANVFAGLLDREDGTPTPANGAAPTDEAPGDEGVAEQAEPQTEETPPEEQPEGEPESDEAADTPDEESEEGEPKATPLYTVKIDGKSEQVTLEEALKGYSRTRDYTQKTDALATDRHVLEQERSEVLKERQQYATLLVALQKQLQPAEQEPDWEAMYRQDPFHWAKARDEWRDKQDKLAAANFELQRLQQVESQEQKAAYQKQLYDGRTKMLEMEPSWKDTKKWEADRLRIVEYAQKKGYTADEIANALDPRAIVILNEARQWAELKGTKSPQPTAQRVGPKAASAGSAPVAHNQTQRARQRLAQTGRVEDAAKVFMGIL